LVGCAAPLEASWSIHRTSYIGGYELGNHILIHVFRIFPTLVLATVLAGCSTLIPQTIALRTSWPADVPLAADVSGVPFYPQQGQWCGAASLAAALNHSAIPATPTSLAALVFAPGLGGSLQVEMLAAARRSGALAYPLRPQIVDLLREVAAGHPVLVLQDNGFGLISAWHYALVVGYNYTLGELYLRSGTNPRLAMPFTVFEASWRSGQYWSMVVVPPSVIPATANETDLLVALLALSQSAAVQNSLRAPASRRPDPAIVGLRTFLVRWPANELASAALANLHYAQQELQQAEIVLRAALRLVPQSVTLRNNLAQVLIDQYRCVDAASEISQLPPLQGAQIRFAADITDTSRAIEVLRAEGKCEIPTKRHASN
jgi:hypothetical protein